MTLRVLIVDDEPLAREGVALLLAREEGIDVIGESASGSEAISAIKTHKPDLVFLDVNMPKISGFDVIKAIGVKLMPMVIFLTAYDEFAVKAFQVNAIDYLLKPINGAYFKEAISKAKQALSTRELEHRANQLSILLNTPLSTEAAEPDSEIKSELKNERLVIRSSGHLHFLKPVDIQWVEACGDYVNIHAVDKKHMIRETMRNMEEQLSPYGFQRIHRSAIVRLDSVRELKSLDSGEFQVTTDNGTLLKLSRNYREAFFLKLKYKP